MSRPWKAEPTTKVLPGLFQSAEGKLEDRSTELHTISFLSTLLHKAEEALSG
jgi:hypothetical protein